ncbi:MAG: glycosyltransferase family protein [Patescibacteria group bacterium]
MYKDRSERIVATIEARMTSTRLPGKVLMPLVGKPVLQHIIERLQRSQYVDVICLATTTNKTDDPTAALAEDLGVAVFRGSEEDVLGRVLGAAQSVRADLIVEVSGDCPAIDHRDIDRGIEEFFKSGAEYVANNIEATYPTGGFEVIIFRTSALAEVAAIVKEPIYRTHVSYYFATHPEKYRQQNFKAPLKATAPELRVVLDEKADYELLNKVFESLYPLTPDFGAEDVVQFLKANPQVAALNSNVRRKKAHEL